MILRYGSPHLLSLRHQTLVNPAMPKFHQYGYTAKGICKACGFDSFYIGIANSGGFSAHCTNCGEVWATKIGKSGQDAGGHQAVAEGTGEDEPGNVVPAAEGEEGWQPAMTMPFNRTVVVKTVKGLVRLARRNWDGYEVNKPSEMITKVHCWRQDTSGDLMATHWKEP
jgi:hypothetical protein